MLSLSELRLNQFKTVQSLVNTRNSSFCMTGRAFLGTNLNNATAVCQYLNFHFHGFHNGNHLPLGDLLTIFNFQALITPLIGASKCSALTSGSAVWA